ncbi:DUF3152 domain-containing protein [Nocardioides litoris]|uniref:DUF3152 domain-containing protein n=1 Tax=Nocardioides litoris TaxID=1926648 RepID=UPI00111FEED9|nr:DUF3152 domain-containing protein [Nocardioides litoris]
MPRPETARVLAAGLAVLLALGLLVGAPSPARAAAAPVTSTSPPVVSGAATWGEPLTATAGTWDPPGVTAAYRWLRSGRPVPGATAAVYRLGTADLGHRVQVEVVVTSTDGSGATGRAVSAPTAPVARADQRLRRAPRVVGDARFGRTVRATAGRWTTTPDWVRYRWLRAGRPVPGARGPRYTLRPDDVGRRLRVEVTARAEGHRTVTVRSAPVRVEHRVGVRRTVTYSVTTRGRVSADLGAFRRLAQQTYDDPRGWRGMGVRFRPVRSGGSFTLVLAEASTLPSYSRACSTQWSCRVGRYVVINQTRWQHASPAWNGARRSLRDYRHMVVNHETGHWLGRGHASCPRPGALAPVMQQQSKGTQGCRLNPWPTLGELR